MNEMLLLLLQFIVLFCSLRSARFDEAVMRSPPKWSLVYSVMGTLSIPYAEISEPFAAYVDLIHGKSRIDYYGGMMKTFQRADIGKYGTTYKMVPMTNEKVENQENCFQVNGTNNSRILPQSILPNISDFTFITTEVKKGHECEKWQKKEVIGKKVNKYTMWLKIVHSPLNPSLGIAIPIHYEMKGYNSLLGSHYDHYFLDYVNFSPSLPDPNIFEKFRVKKCHGFPGPGIDHTYTMNPMKEFIDGDTSHVDETFDRFRQRHRKTYRDENERESRKDIYRQNMRFIHSTNRRGLSYTLNSNHLADRTDDEIKILRGKLFTEGYNGGLPFSYTMADLNGATDTLDWRLSGAVSPVKDQSVCGSCWSFGTVGALEGALFLKTGQLIRLSQQALIDCSWGFGNNGCDGGEDFRAYDWIMKHNGIPSEDNYGPYLGADGYCHIDEVEMTFPIAGFVNVTSGDVDAVRVALAKHGPLSVAIDASQKSLTFYTSGVYYETKCKNAAKDLDHAVLAVGYGQMNGEKYWLIKNSWSTYWGNDGYILMSQKDNNCGVATSATYVIPK